jgi:hypothetical protein
LVDRFSKFLYCGLKLEVLLLQQRGDLFSGVGAARQHCFHDYTRVLNDVLPCIVEQYRSRDVTNHTEAEREEGDENQIEFEQFHS